MKKTQKILNILLTVSALLLSLAAAASMTSCSSRKANQDVAPHDIVDKAVSTLGIKDADISAQYYSEGGADNVYDDAMLKIMFPPSGTTDYTTSLFDKYALIQIDTTKPVMFEIGVFKMPEGDTNAINTVKTMCTERIAKVKSEIFGYNQAMAYLADNATAVVFDNYVYYVIADNSSKAYDAIKSELTAK